MSTNMKAQAPSRAEGNGSSPADERDQRHQRGSAKAQRPLRYRWTDYVIGLGNLLSPAAHHFALLLSYQWMQADGRVGRRLPDGRIESVSLETIAEAMGVREPVNPEQGAARAA